MVCELLLQRRSFERRGVPLEERGVAAEELVRSHGFKPAEELVEANARIREAESVFFFPRK